MTPKSFKPNPFDRIPADRIKRTIRTNNAKSDPETENYPRTFCTSPHKNKKNVFPSGSFSLINLSLRRVKFLPQHLVPLNRQSTV